MSSSRATQTVTIPNQNTNININQQPNVNSQSNAYKTYNTNEQANVQTQNFKSMMSKNYSSDLNKSWPKVINDLKQCGKMVLYTSLQGTSAEKINDGTVAIKFKSKMNGLSRNVLNKQGKR